MKQSVAFSSPVSMLYARNAWDHDPLLVTKTKRLAFYDFYEFKTKFEVSQTRRYVFVLNKKGRSKESAKLIFANSLSWGHFAVKEQPAKSCVTTCCELSIRTRKSQSRLQI